MSEKLVDHIIRFITDLKLYDEANKIIPNTINKIYIGGVGSHIKGLDEKINRALNFKIDRIDSIDWIDLILCCAIRAFCWGNVFFDFFKNRPIEVDLIYDDLVP